MDSKNSNTILLSKKWDRLKAIKKANKSKLHDFYYLRDKSISSGLKQLMLTFTYKDDDKYFKMDVINHIKNYVTKQLRNYGIKYYATIEVGSDYDNPHAHFQIYYDDISKINHIKDATVERYGLFSEYSTTTIPKCKDVRYDYVVKDYKIQDDNQLLLLDDVKRDYRSKLHKNIRFTSFSKEKYSKAIYKKAYSHGILKQNVDWLIDNCIISKDIEVTDYRVIYWFEMMVYYYFQSFSIIIELVSMSTTLMSETYGIKKATHQTKQKICFEIYGFS